MRGGRANSSPAGSVSLDDLLKASVRNLEGERPPSASCHSI
jgi:hypothetical protein